MSKTAETKELPPYEEIAEAVAGVSRAAKKIEQSRLTKNAVVILIQHMTRPKVSQNSIELVLSCAADLEARYLKKKHATTHRRR